MENPNNKNVSNKLTKEQQKVNKNDIARVKYLKGDKKLNQYIHYLAFRYDLPVDAFYRRLSIEGVIDERIRKINAGKIDPNESLLDSKESDVNLRKWYGLDYIGELYNKNQLDLLRNFNVREYNPILTNRDGSKQQLYSAKVDNHKDALDMMAAQLAYDRDRAVEYLGQDASKEDISKMTQLMYKQGVRGAKNDYLKKGKGAYDLINIYVSPTLQDYINTESPKYNVTTSPPEIPMNNIYYNLNNNLNGNSWNAIIDGAKARYNTTSPIRFGLGGNSTYGTRITSDNISNSEVGGGKMIAGSAVSGLGSGAALGATIGSVIPGIGTVIGGIIGGIGGLISGLFGGGSKAKQAREEAARLKEAQRIQTIQNMDTKLENDVYLTRQATDQSKVNNLGFQMKYGGRTYRPIFANGGSSNKIKVNIPSIGFFTNNQIDKKLNSEEQARYDLLKGNYTAMGEGMADYAYRHGESENLDQGDWNEYLPKYREMVSNIQTKIEDDINMFRPTEEGDDKTTFAITTDYQMPYGGIVPNSRNTLVAYGQRHEQYDPQTGETGVPYNDIEVEGGGMIGNKALAGEVIKQTPTGDLVFSDRLKIPNTKYTYADVAKHISDKKGIIEKELVSTTTNLDKALSLIGKSRTTFANRGTQQRTIEKLATQVNMDVARLQELDSQLNDVYTTQEEHATMLGLRNNNGQPTRIMACGGKRRYADGGGFFKNFGIANSIGLGAQLLTGIGSYISNRGFAKQYTNMPIPLQTKETAPIYEWRYNVGNEIEDINRQVRTANNYITRNVSNAQVARNLVSQNAIQGARARGQVYAKQNQIEQQGRNRNILARYETNRANAQKMYQNAVDRYNQQVTALSMRQQANQTFAKDMMGVVQGGLNLYAQKYAIDKMGKMWPKVVERELNDTSKAPSLTNQNPIVNLSWMNRNYINPYPYLIYGAGAYETNNFKVPPISPMSMFQ